MAKHILYAGSSIVDISPKPGIPLAGYPHFPRYNTGVHDPLYASCLTLDDGVACLAIVCADLVGISKALTRRVRRGVESQTGIPGANIMLACSHTHSGPWTAMEFDSDSADGLTKQDAGFVAELEEKLIQLVVSSARNPFEAKIGIEKGICGKEQGIGGNRRDPKGPVDPEVWTIGVQDLAGKWRACLVKYALHPTVIHEDSTVVTADYPAYIRSYLAKTHPGMIMLFAQGVSGDQSSRYFRKGQSFGEAERIGSTIGKTAADVLARMPLSATVPLAAQSGIAEIQLRKLPPCAELENMIAQAKRNYEALKFAKAPYLDIQNANLALLGAEDLLALHTVQEHKPTCEMLNDEPHAEVQVFGVGDTRMVGLPGEIFVEFGLQIQKASPLPKTFVIELANGYLPGYVCTAEAYARGGYETGASMLTVQAGDALVATSLRLLNELSASSRH